MNARPGEFESPAAISRIAERLDLLSEDTWIGAESWFPQIRSQDDLMVAARAPLMLGEESAHQRFQRRASGTWRLWCGDRRRAKVSRRPQS